MQFNARLISIVAALLLPVFLAGCEERKEPVFGETSFRLVVPAPDSNVSDISTGKMKVDYTGKVTLSNIVLELNGADVTDKFSMSTTSNRAVVPLADLRNVLVQGENTLIAGQMKLDANDVPVLDTNGRPVLVFSETFHFFLDNKSPRVRVTSVVPATANVDGSPQTGTTITVEGEMVDLSGIKRLSFTYPGGSQDLTETINNPVGNNQFNNATKTFRVSLPNYPDTSTATGSAHFTYTIEDEFEHVGSESFMASGTFISRQKALQINDSLTWNISPFIKPLIGNALSLANAANLFGLGKPLKLATIQSPVPGDLMENPLTNCQPSTVAEGVMECIPTAYGGTTRIFIYPSDSTQCSSMLFAQSAGVTHCVVFIKKINVTPQDLDINFHESYRGAGDMLLALDLWIANAAVDVEVAGVRVVGADTYYLGGLQGTVSLNRFSIATDIKLYGDNYNVINATRVTPFHLVLTDLLKVPTLWGSCNICSPLVSPLSLIVLALGTDLNTNGQVDKKELISMIGQAIEDNVGTVFDTALGNLVVGSTTYEQNAPVNDKQITRNSRIVNAHTVYFNNGHFVFNGNDFVDPAFYAPNYVAVNGGLGSVFAPQGKYYSNLPFIPGWGISSKGGEKNIDMSFAVSANSVNQWLLSNHQTGMFDEFELTMTGADLAPGNMAVDQTDQLSLTFNTNEAPTVQFKSEDTTSFGICNGATLCFNPDAASLGSVKIAVNNLDLHLDNITDAAVLVDANIDFEMAVELSLVSGKPNFKLIDNSIVVQVNDLTQPNPALVSKGALSLAIEESVLNYLVSPSFQAMLGQQVQTIAISDLPGFGGSGVNCAGPSVNGQFCAGGTQVPYSSLFIGAIPRDFALLFRWLTIEKGGSYLSFAIDIRNKEAGTWTAQELADNFITLQITN